MTAAIVLQALQIVAAAAPGLLAAMTAHTTDAEALETTRRAMDMLKSDPVGGAIDAWKRARGRA